MKETLSISPLHQVLGIGGCLTIDSANDDGGTLNKVRLQNPGAGADGSTAEAAANLLRCLGPSRGIGNILGHGNDGVITTGSGQTGSNPDKYMAQWNPAYWHASMGQLKNRLLNLSLWACHPGTGDVGADFLYDIAKIVNAAVAGPTGFLYVDGAGNVTLEARSTWQVATPTNRPPAIAAPTPHFTRPDFFVIFKEGAMKNVPFSDSVSIRISGYNLFNQETEITVSNKEAKDLLRNIDFENPFVPPGIPLARITAYLTVTFYENNDNSIVESTRYYKVYNNRLVEDLANPGEFFTCSAMFQKALSSFL